MIQYLNASMIQYNKSMNPTHPATLPVAAGQLPAVPLTVEGYATLHQMMRFRRTAWRALPEKDRREIADRDGRQDRRPVRPVLRARTQRRPDAGPLPRDLRPAQSGGARSGPP